MKKLNKILLLLALITVSFAANAQNMSDIRINEFTVASDSTGCIDDYGCKVAWIELFNTSYGTVDIAGCYLSTDSDNLKMHVFPKGSKSTKILPRQHLLIYVDGCADKGPLHAGISFEGAKTIIFTSSDGRTVIDSAVIPSDLQPNQSYGRIVDGEGYAENPSFAYMSSNISKKIAAQQGDKGWGILANATPGYNNQKASVVSKSQLIKEVDPHGVFMSITAMSVVFLALILLYFVFKYIGKHNINKAAQNAKDVNAPEGVTPAGKHTHSGRVSAEVYAAVSAAVYRYIQDNEAHDHEDTVLTINKVSRAYSPWSSKIHTLRETPVVIKRK
ncbi:MAG: OadG family protein [Bacteroidales bacterium]|nr:OadG family protein [Bacteroidales bacterium]